MVWVFFKKMPFKKLANYLLVFAKVMHFIVEKRSLACIFRCLLFLPVIIDSRVSLLVNTFTIENQAVFVNVLIIV